MADDLPKVIALTCDRQVLNQGLFTPSLGFSLQYQALSCWESESMCFICLQSPECP